MESAEDLRSSVATANRTTITRIGSEDPIPQNEEAISDDVKSRNVLLLSLAFMMTTASSNVFLSIGGPDMRRFGSKKDAVIMVGLYALGISFMAVMTGSVWLKVLGKSHGFILGSLSLIFGGGLCSYASTCDMGSLMMLGSFFIGMGQGNANFYRFSAAEFYVEDSSKRAVALSYVLTGGFGASFLGLVTLSIEGAGGKYWDTWLLIPALAVVGLILQSFVQFPSQPRLTLAEALDNLQRLGQSVKQKNSTEVGFGITVSTCSVFIVIMLMATMSVELVEQQHATPETIAIVYAIHFVGMYGFSMFAGHTIANYGILPVLLLSVACAYAGLSLIMEYFPNEDGLDGVTAGFFLGGLVFSTGFSTGSICLQRGIQDPSSAPAATAASAQGKGTPSEYQGMHDGVVYLFAGVASIIASELYMAVGLSGVLLLGYAVAFVNAVVIALVYYRGSVEFGPRSGSRPHPDDEKKSENTIRESALNPITEL